MPRPAERELSSRAAHRGIEDASSVAYVVRNKLFVKLTKILGVMFPKIRHEAFTSRAEAVAWLDSFDKA